MNEENASVDNQIGDLHSLMAEIRAITSVAMMAIDHTESCNIFAAIDRVTQAGSAAINRLERTLSEYEKKQQVSGAMA